MSQAILEIKHLKKSFGANEVLKDISLAVHKGEVISIIGSSGSGKSTLLRSINLLEEPSGGQIIFHGQDVLTFHSIPHPLLRNVEDPDLSGNGAPGADYLSMQVSQHGGRWIDSHVIPDSV